MKKRCVGFSDIPQNIGRMKRIQQTFRAILAEEAESQIELKKAFKGLDYEI